MSKKLIFLASFFIVFNIYSQDLYFYNVELSDRLNVPSFERKDNLIKYAGKEKEIIKFFDEYKIVDFYQTFSDSRRERTLNIYTFVVYDKSFGQKLLKEFPKQYIGFQNISDFKVDLTTTYPNDYGNTSPSNNLGVPESLKNFDYINVPKAWDYGYGSNSIRIGISDAKINENDLDFKNKLSVLSGYTNTYLNAPFSMSSDIYWHGSATAAIAGAQGDNGQGITGICSNCSLVANSYGYGNPGTYNNPTPNLNNLLQLAISGVKVINMSWAMMSTSPPKSYNYYQWVFDELHEDYNVVCVASSGNVNSYQAIYQQNNFMLYGYPASFNHVISVISVNHKNASYEDQITHETYGDVSWYNEDLIAPTGTYQNGIYSSFDAAHTSNDLVDIAAPGWSVFQYPWYILNNTSQGLPSYYGSGTSSSAPHVTGTIGLMFSQNECLLVDEIEDIIQLTSKNIESNPANNFFIGRSGSGKLETGDAVEFVHEAMALNGNAIIDGQDFWRFNFDLKHIMNKLTISNQIFRDNNMSDFTSKNCIEILSNVDFRPNNNGLIDLKTNRNLSLCKPITDKYYNFEKLESANTSLSENITLYPNPNNGNFTIDLNNKEIKDVSIEIYNVYGNRVYSKEFKNDLITISIDNLAIGVYFVKVKSDVINKELKFIKN